MPQFSDAGSSVTVCTTQKQHCYSFLREFSSDASIVSEAYPNYCVRCGTAPVILHADGNQKSAFAVRLGAVLPETEEATTVSISQFWSNVEDWLDGAVYQTQPLKGRTLSPNMIGGFRGSVSSLPVT